MQLSVHRSKLNLCIWNFVQQAHQKCLNPLAHVDKVLI
jgi:hypothetical protein